MALTGSNNEQKIWNYLIKAGFTENGTAALMGNLKAESRLESVIMETSYQKKIGHNSTTYTNAVDKGTYTNFVKDCVGYGLAQWTWWERKQKLLHYAKSKNKSIGDLEMQLEFLVNELKNSYKTIYNMMKTNANIYSISTKILLDFENPADKSSRVKELRSSYGEAIYKRNHGTVANTTTTTTTTEADPPTPPIPDPETPPMPTTTTTNNTTTTKSTTTSVKKDNTKIDYAKSFSKSKSRKYKVTANSLYVRTGAGTVKKIITAIPKNTVVTCYGYYTTVDKVDWLLIEVIKDNIKYTGFCSSKWLV